MRFLFIVLSLISFNVFAQETSLGNTELGNIFDMVSQNEKNEGIKSFANPDKKNIKEEAKQKEDPILPEITLAASRLAIDNITQAEQVFCYNIEKRPNKYDGYTLNGFAVTGFCGVINKTLQKRIANEFLRTQKNILFNQKEDCSIQPKVMLRFFRGVDHTDILISSPCFSYAIFYANKLKAFNSKPMQVFIKSLIKTFEDAKTDFVSPSLYNQLVPIGQEPNKKGTPKPVEIKEPKKLKGWQNLSF